MADHKDPTDRAHLWERPKRADEHEGAPVTDDASDYTHALPRHLYGPDLATVIVTTPEECDAKLKAGYALKPVGVAVQRKGESHLVYTKEALSVAVAQGWDVAPVESKPAKK